MLLVLRVRVQDFYLYYGTGVYKYSTCSTQGLLYTAVDVLSIVYPLDLVHCTNVHVLSTSIHVESTSTVNSVLSTIDSS